MTVPLTLCDRSPEMVQAWRHYFPIDMGIKIANQNLLSLDVDALAIPANAFGFTDGGVDMAISHEVFDWNLQEVMQEIIKKKYHGELIVGQALVLPTGSNRFRYVVVAPTMRVPGDVSNTVNAFLAMRAILIAVDDYNRAASGRVVERIRSLAVPGLCTGIGKMPPQRAAYQMVTAYSSIVLADLEWSRTLERQVEHDRKMRERQ